MVAISAVATNASTSASTAAPQNEWSDRPLSDVICLFDVDGTLSPSRKVKVKSFNKFSCLFYRLLPLK